MEGKWLKQPQHKEVIVFIHGVLSSGEDCWQHANGTYWPKLVADDPTLDTYGVYVFTYHTGIFSGNYRMGDIVDALKVHMNLDGVLKNQVIVFVAHSMGGIIARKFLVERVLEFFNKDKSVGLFLVASPSLGASYADWLSPLAKVFGHRQADALRFVRNNDWLSDLDKEFTNLKESGNINLKGQEIIEDKFVVLRWLWFWRQVVEPFSGAKYFGEPYKVPKSDHFSISKPSGASDIQHRMLRDFLVGRNVFRRKSIFSDLEGQYLNRTSCSPTMPTIGLRSRGSLVRVVQYRLSVNPDGLFGPETQRAVQNFQKANNLIADGLVGPLTWDAFPILGVGSEGPVVEQIQRKLGLKIDGKFGSITEIEVMNHQKNNNLSADGLVGPDTLKSLGL